MFKYKRLISAGTEAGENFYNIHARPYPDWCFQVFAVPISLPKPCGFYGAPRLSWPRAVQVLHCGSAQNSWNCMRMRRLVEGHSFPPGLPHHSYLDDCTQRRARLKFCPQSLTRLPDSLSGCSGERRTEEPPGGLGYGTLRLARRREECGRSLRTERERPRLQPHPKHLQPVRKKKVRDN